MLSSVRWAVSVGVAGLACLSLCPLARPVSNDRSDFVTFVRLGESEPDAASLAAFDRLGIEGRLLRPDQLAGGEVGPETPLLVDPVLVGEGLRLRSETFERFFDRYRLDRDPELIERPFCFNLEMANRSLLSEFDSVLRSMPLDGVCAVSIVRDPSVSFGGEPFDWCFGPSCLGRWRADLRRRFGGIESIGRRLGQSAARLGDLRPWTVDEVRARNEGRPRSAVNLAPWLDHRTFMDRTFAAALGRLAERARGELSGRTGIRVGFLGGEPTNTFGGHDWSKLSRVVDLLSPPNDPTSRLVVRDTAAPDLLVLTEVQLGRGSARAARRRLVDHLLLGSRGVIVSSPRGITDSAGEPSPFALEFAATLEKVRDRAAPELHRAVPVDDEVGILYSPNSMRIAWLLRTADDGIYWLTRSSGRGGQVLALANTWWGWQRLLEDAGFCYRFVFEADLLRDDRDPLRSLKGLVLPRQLSVSDRLASRLREFVRAGGLLVADGELGLFDGGGRGRAAGRLDDLFGVDRPASEEAWDEGATVEEEEPDRIYGLRRLEPAVSVDQSEASERAIYLNVRIGDYLEAREEEEAAVMPLLELLRERFALVGIESRYRVSSAEEKPRPPRVRLLRYRAEDGAELISLMRNVALPEARRADRAFVPPDEARFELRFSTPQRVTDLLSGEVLEEVERVQLDLALDEFALYRVESR